MCSLVQGCAGLCCVTQRHAAPCMSFIDRILLLNARILALCSSTAQAQGTPCHRDGFGTYLSWWARCWIVGACTSLRVSAPQESVARAVDQPERFVGATGIHRALASGRIRRRGGDIRWATGDDGRWSRRELWSPVLSVDPVRAHGHGNSPRYL